MPSGRRSGKGDLIRVSAKAGNVFPHPAERSQLVFQAQIDDVIVHIVKIAEGTEPIRDGHYYDITFFGKHGAIIGRFFIPNSGWP